jgi:hypothetical protein
MPWSAVRISGLDLLLGVGLRTPDFSPVSLSRRTFLATGLVTLGLASATPFIRRRGRRSFRGGIVGGKSALGHAVRDRQLPPPTEKAETGIAIIGSGIAGLAAARRLQRRGLRDYCLLELEAQPGGNAISGRNSVSAYPWAAHYVPISGRDANEVTQLFEELGIIIGRDPAGLPIYREEYLCADPMERLFIGGRWQEGLVPQLGVPAFDQQKLDAFFAEMQRLKCCRGSDGRRAFTIPLDASSRDDEFTRLDTITMAHYLRRKGWNDCGPLRWYVDYCCRDDYGAGIEKVSAWAGVHYFASRDAQAANAPSYAVVTWPEGNGWFVRELKSAFAQCIRSGCAVWNVQPDADRWLVDYYDARRGKSVRLRARGVVWAAPQFVARRVIASLRESPTSASVPVYSPWMVANLTLDALPTGAGLDLAWDNVLFGSKSLGYVVATHQNFHPVPRRTVLTYYLPLDDEEPTAARQKALTRPYEDWCELIVEDLAHAHPNIADHITQLDVWVWGHAMVRPVPGYIWGPERAKIERSMRSLVFAHSDLSGIALFEEAYTRGVRAADLLQRNLG